MLQTHFLEKKFGLFYWNYLQPIAIGFMVLALIPLLIKFILAYKQGDFKKSGKVSAKARPIRMFQS